MKKKHLTYLLIFISALLFYQYGRTIWHPTALKLLVKKTVSEVIETYEHSTYENLYPLFDKAGVIYPPKQLALIAFKKEKILELWASNGSDAYKLITQYPIKATSGFLGPKLEEGDRQVPEGLYQIIGFNPNSAFHLSMKLNYPNQFDLKYANEEGRDKPGTNIFIHGRAVSIGCLAMGNKTIEKLFTLIYKTGKSNVQVLISPTDPSIDQLKPPKGAPEWTPELYEIIENQYFKITKNIVNL